LEAADFDAAGFAAPLETTELAAPAGFLSEAAFFSGAVFFTVVLFAIVSPSTAWPIATGRITTQAAFGSESC
jgi:hypothetical protein